MTPDPEPRLLPIDHTLLPFVRSPLRVVIIFCVLLAGLLVLSGILGHVVPGPVAAVLSMASGVLVGFALRGVLNSRWRWEDWENWREREMFRQTRICHNGLIQRDVQ